MRRTWTSPISKSSASSAPWRRRDTGRGDTITTARQDHRHREPSPEAQQTAEAMLLLTASAFVCTFVVVVLDGACAFGAHAGYYY